MRKNVAEVRHRCGEQRPAVPNAPVLYGTAAQTQQQRRAPLTRKDVAEAECATALTSIISPALKQPHNTMQ